MQKSMKLRWNPIVTAVFIVLALVFAGASGQAAGWENEVSIYGWFAGVDASTRIPLDDGSDAEVDASDVLENINMVFMGNYVGKYDRWSIIADAVFLDVGDSGSTNVQGQTVSAAFDLKTWLLTGAIAYDLVQNQDAQFAVAAGTRYLNLEADAQLAFNGASLGGISESTGLWDGFIGVRGVFFLTDNWFLPCDVLHQILKRGLLKHFSHSPDRLFKYAVHRTRCSQGAASLISKASIGG